MIKFGLSIEDDDEAEDVEELYVYVCAYCLLSFEGDPTATGSRSVRVCGRCFLGANNDT